MPADNIYFMLSGVDLGLYTFPQNPQSMNIIAPRSDQKKLNLIRGEDIYMRSLLDQNMRKMSWKRTTNAVYSGLKTYAVRDANGDIPISYFWDGTVNEFHGMPVRVIDVYGKPIVNDGTGSSSIMTLPSETVWAVELLFRPVRV